MKVDLKLIRRNFDRIEQRMIAAAEKGHEAEAACYSNAVDVYQPIALLWLEDAETREANQALVDVSWLKTIGFEELENGSLFMRGPPEGYYIIEVHPHIDGQIRMMGFGPITIGQMKTTTRQMMLDFLRGLKCID